MMNCTMHARLPCPAARSAMPSAAVVLPLPPPVYTMSRPTGPGRALPCKKSWQARVLGVLYENQKNRPARPHTIYTGAARAAPALDARIVVAGASSGSGKTSVACAISYGLARRGYSVQPFKVGPDYIDPGHLGAAAGRDALNLDAWLMGRDELLRAFASREADVAVIEGVMGYYDGASGRGDLASTYQVASLLGCNTLLVLDASGTARSLAATALGFSEFRRDARICGVVLNRVKSARHERMCREAMAEAGIEVLGAVPHDPGSSVPSRHLGLVPAREASAGRRTAEAARAASEFIDLDRVLELARAEPVRARAPREPAPQKCTVAVALDDSFNFYYPANLEELRRCGARTVFFSPLSDPRVPDCDGLYIGGGFPEVMAQRLSQNGPMLSSVKKTVEGGAPAYAECGGLMYLARSIRDEKSHAMAGVIDADSRMTGRLTLNYTEGRVAIDCAVSRAQRGFRGHEFHYSRTDAPPDARFAYELSAGEGVGGGRDGIVQDGLLASYGHLYFGGARFAGEFVGRCVSFCTGR